MVCATMICFWNLKYEMLLLEMKDSDCLEVVIMFVFVISLCSRWLLPIPCAYCFVPLCLDLQKPWYAFSMTTEFRGTTFGDLFWSLCRIWMDGHGVRRSMCRNLPADIILENLGLRICQLNLRLCIFVGSILLQTWKDLSSQARRNRSCSTCNCLTTLCISWGRCQHVVLRKSLLEVSVEWQVEDRLWCGL